MTTIALVGNPNSGKTTLFNALTGTRQRVGNWPGVTVERKSGSYPHGDAKVEALAVRRRDRDERAPPILDKLREWAFLQRG